MMDDKDAEAFWKQMDKLQKEKAMNVDKLREQLKIV